MADKKRSGGVSLTEQQKMMWKVRHRGQMKDLGPDEKKAFGKKLKADLNAMSETELARTIASLNRDWDKLPPDMREKKMARLAAKAKKADH